jgi:ATP-dependent helicase/nuclease subunit A
MKKDLGNIEYDEAAALYVGREEEKEYAGGDDCEVMILQSSDEVSNQELEARAIAGRMKELHKAGVAYSDMAVLLRSMKGWSEEIVGVLKEEGIPAKATTQTGYFSATEVALILNLLLIIDNPLQDIPLASVLRSPIGGFTDDELVELRCLNREGSLYDCVVECISEAATSNKAAKFFALLEEFRSLVPFVGIYELLSVIYEKTGYYNYAKALPGGAARCANLDMLLEKGADFERTSYGGLFQFNRYIERLHRYEVDFGEAEALGENRDTVTIMSIHKSKGLEFPVVFLAGMGKSFNKQDTRERILLHPDLGIGPDYIDSTLRTKSPTLLKQVIKRRSELESIGEELRVLYVAMTRARDKLYLTGCVKETEKAMARWTQGKLLLFSQRAGAASFFDFIMPRVLLWQECEPVCESKRKPGSGEGASFLVTYLTEEELTFETVAEKISKESQRMELLALEGKTVWSEEEMDKAEAILSYTYPYKKEKEIKSKFTVSELKRLSYQEEEEVPLWQPPVCEAYVPLFAREDKEVTGSVRGTVYHRILEQISFVAARTEGFSKELNRLIEKKRLTKEEEKLVSKQKLSRFLTSGLGERLQVAEGKGLLHREQPFVIGCLASQVQPKIDSEETVLVQGVIDCFFEEEKGLVLVDYKTDRVATKKELAEKYKSQMDYYRQALEQLTGKPVVEAYLYSFHLGEEIQIDG